MGEKAMESARLHRGADISKVIRAGLVILAVTFGGIGGWAALAPLSGAVVAQGIVKVDDNRKTIQHMEGGIVREIMVSDGDHVDVGDTLLVVGNESVDASVDVLGGQLLAERIRLARLEAERALADAIQFPRSVLDQDASPDVKLRLERETTFFSTRRERLNAQIELLQQQEQQIEAEIAGLTQEIVAMQKAQVHLGEEIGAVQELEKKQYAQRMEVPRLQRTLQEYLAREGEHRADIARARQKLIDMRLQITSRQSEYVETAANDLTVAQAKIYDLEERIRPSLDAERRQQITAPISGTVVGLKVFTLGGVVAPREPLLDIVPDETPLIVETNIDINSIDEVRVGMVATVRLTAYKSRTTSAILGRVSYVSADRLTNPNTQAAYYVAHVILDPKSLQEAGEVRLTPGMAADVYIETRTRTALDYLLDPMTSFVRKSFRET
jgi:HlyD family type I secretion membrane fusion protein